MIEDSYNLLQHLNLEGNRMGDAALITICQRSHYNNLLKVFNINDNLITCKSMPAVSGMIKYSALTTLLMGWNFIAAAGVTVLWKELERTDSLKVLDLSFNKISKKSVKVKDEYPECLAKMLKENTSILHIDLSHNEITEKDGEIIAKGLNENHSILGLHLTGNYISLTAEGFITKQKPHPAADSHIMIRLNESLLMGVWKSSLNVELRATTNWWICEGWSEVKFMFDLTTSDFVLTEDDGVLKGVNIHLDFDDYMPDMMKRSTKNPNLFTSVRMVPPRVKIRYYFSLALEKVIPVTPVPEKQSSRFIKPKKTKIKSKQVQDIQ
jgi:Leucine-rich repeat (LRR) protein